jgi:hypothetical protein
VVLLLYSVYSESLQKNNTATRGKKQDAFAAVPSRRAVCVDGRSPRAAVRALGRETALQPTSNTVSWLSKADVSTQLPVTGSALIFFVCLCRCKHPARLPARLPYIAVFLALAAIAGWRKPRRVHANKVPADASRYPSARVR